MMTTGSRTLLASAVLALVGTVLAADDRPAHGAPGSMVPSSYASAGVINEGGAGEAGHFLGNVLRVDSGS